MTFIDYPPPHYPPQVTVASLRLWSRIEPIPRTDDLDVSLRAEIADPLWMLVRQRQFGELTGEDAGSPIEVRCTATTAPVSRFHPAGLLAGTAVDVDDSMPLEVAVEREPRLDFPESVMVTPVVAAQAGLHWLRLLRAGGVGHLQDLYRQHCAFTAENAVVMYYPIPSVAVDLPEPGEAAVSFRERVIGRVPDGRQLFLDFRDRRDASGAVTGLPAEPAVPAADVPAVQDAATRFLAWWDAAVPQSWQTQGDTWDPQHLEHRFDLQADLGDGPVVLRAGHRGGHLDWYSFTAAGGPDLGAPATPRPPAAVVRSMLPTPVAYPGMPADRFWAIEDGAVRFGGLDTGRADLARLLLAEFALTYGNDWFLVPLELDAGSVCRIESVEVVDTFGDTAVIERSTDPSWRLFGIDAPDGPDRVSNLFFLAPALPQSHESEPIEEVRFARDEMANVAWMIERTVQGVTGFTVDRGEEHQRWLAAQRPEALDAGTAELVYRLATEVPGHWIPLVPTSTPGVSPSAAAVVLAPRPLTRTRPDGTTETLSPRSRVLFGLPVAEEEVPRAGTEVVRVHQLTRGYGGRYHLWTARKRRTGRGEASSGLRFDAVTPVPAPS